MEAGVASWEGAKKEINLKPGFEGSRLVALNWDQDEAGRMTSERFQKKIYVGKKYGVEWIELLRSSIRTVEIRTCSGLGKPEWLGCPKRKGKSSGLLPGEGRSLPVSRERFLSTPPQVPAFSRPTVSLVVLWSQ